MRLVLMMLTILAMLAAAGTALGEIYRTVDEHGNIVYTDIPPDDDAEVVKLQPLSVADPVPVTPRPRAAVEPAAQEQAVRYRISLVSPKSDETFWGTAGNLAVQVSTRPSLQPGHSVAVYLNGTQVDEMLSPVKTLSGIDRGTHELSVAVINDAGDKVSNTASATFHMKQHSVLLPTARPGLGFKGPGG